jgi:hypothetical protein
MYASAGTAPLYCREMHVEASPEAVHLIEEQGGRLFVWAKRSRCCRGTLTYLETSSEPGDRPFRRVHSEGIQVYFEANLVEPDELVIEASGRRRRHVHAYWNGCAYVI